VRPLAVLLGIIMGSALALAVALSMTAIVFVILHADYASRLAAERGPLLRGLVWSWAFSATGAAGFYGELRERRWRRVPQLILLVACSVLAWRYWPR
jgi:membrane protease YdiL (CAAX protease family)